MTGPFLLLHPDDNVLVARAHAPQGTEIELEGGALRLTESIPMAHKIARAAIASGGTIRKHGMAIGIATEAIAPGAHVHVHNIRSGYTPSVALQDADGRAG